jgi:hypothetical protein
MAQHLHEWGERNEALSKMTAPQILPTTVWGRCRMSVSSLALAHHNVWCVATCFPFFPLFPGPQPAPGLMRFSLWSDDDDEI